MNHWKNERKLGILRGKNIQEKWYFLKIEEKSKPATLVFFTI